MDADPKFSLVDCLRQIFNLTYFAHTFPAGGLSRAFKFRTLCRQFLFITTYLYNIRVLLEFTLIYGHYCLAPHLQKPKQMKQKVKCSKLIKI